MQMGQQSTQSSARCCLLSVGEFHYNVAFASLRASLGRTASWTLLSVRLYRFPRQVGKQCIYCFFRTGRRTRRTINENSISGSLPLPKQQTLSRRRPIVCHRSGCAIVNANSTKRIHLDVTQIALSKKTGQTKFNSISVCE